jgi:FtsH-binding integral membrane protein
MGGAHYANSINFQPGLLGQIGLGLVLPLIGMCIAAASSNPVFSLVGYALICGPFGLILGPIFHQYSPNALLHVAGLTAGITVFMGICGVLFPQVFSRIGGALLISLIGLVVLRIVALFLPAIDFSWVDYLGAGIFSLYIGYDMWRASSIPATLDNAIDVAVSLYLDILNLFLTLLSINSKD